MHYLPVVCHESWRAPQRFRTFGPYSSVSKASCPMASVLRLRPGRLLMSGGRSLTKTLSTALGHEYDPSWSAAANSLCHNKMSLMAAANTLWEVSTETSQYGLSETPFPFREVFALGIPSWLLKEPSSLS